jgi:hypothetical protein
LAASSAIDAPPRLGSYVSEDGSDVYVLKRDGSG